MKLQIIKEVVETALADGDEIRMVIICKDDGWAVHGEGFTTELVVGQLQTLIHNLLANEDEDPNFGRLISFDNVSEPEGIFRSPLISPGTDTEQ